MKVATINQEQMKEENERDAKRGVCITRIRTSKYN